MASRRRLLQLGGTAGAGLALGPVLSSATPAAAASPVAAGASGAAGAGRRAAAIRPPAVPLAVRSPYLSTWLAADNLPGSWPAFWTGRVTAMTGLATVDGTPYLFLGSPSAPGDYPFATMRQTSLTVTATKSEFVLEQAGVELTVTFLSPVTPGDLRRQSQPLSYLAVSARSLDGKPHDVSVYVDISGEWASGDAGRSITWDQQTAADVVTLSYQQSTPDVLRERGDTAEWGTIVLSSPARSGLTWQIGADGDVRRQIATQHTLANTVDQDKPRRINDRYPVFAFNQSLGTVTRRASEPFVVSIGHLREPTVSYLGEQLPPLWKTYWPKWTDMVAEFHRDHAAAVTRCARLDEKVERDAVRAGGPEYAALCALAFRQAYAATDLVSRNGEPWAFLKEISSNGNMQTVDVTYPSMPVWLYADPQYLRLILAPVLDYVEKRGFPKVFAPHDLGAHYPNADGHLSGEGEEDMPVEESANMLIMVAGYLARVPKAEREAYATAHYPILKQWADYLVGNALDPDLQNQTDDFTGFIAHSVNLALKGIVGIGAMSTIATAAGRTSDAMRYLSTARGYITEWERMALDPSGKHLKLAYDRDGTWSLKYNGYADSLLKLGLVPASVQQLEAEWYLQRVATDGIPLDIRHTYTKADWEMWTAAWLKDHAEVRDALIAGLYKFANTTGQRVPLTDWYDVVANRQQGFQARPVVGGFFALLTL
ncbi:glutaminase family protein [Nucisporomicrobium flavum]|uniref:glutaminase family protein n=1 Tax=Nucisporomicrobium flavum TaxID=2785915 RepID=UPI0018F36DBB|nr:glutaminase family protein [Nucisporomicrobium flavum]